MVAGFVVAGTGAVVVAVEVGAESPFVLQEDKRILRANTRMPIFFILW